MDTPIAGGITNPKAVCPNCLSPNDGATPIVADPSDRPTEGDVSVCVYCGAVLIFNADLTLRLPTLDEVKGWDTDVLTQLAAGQRLAHDIAKES